MGGLTLGEMKGEFVVSCDLFALPRHSENLGGLPLHRAAILRCRVIKDARPNPAAVITLYRSRMKRAAADSFL